jgi:hypothetical protein
MSISRDVSHRLLELSQVVLSNIEIGRTVEAKTATLRLSALIALETDRSDQLEKYLVEDSTLELL